MDAIRTSGLTKTYGTKCAVDDVSLRVGSGEIYGFVGQNGAGKSTFMKMLAGLVLPSAGEIEILGERLSPGCTSRRLGALIEHPGIHLDLTGLDNVMVRALSLGVPQARTASMETLKVVGLESAATKRAGAYSLGMKQRLGLAIALVGSPDILLLDEPFNGLDPQGVREVRSLIMALARTRSLTVFISSHVLDQLERMVSCYGVIREGKLVCQMSAAEVEAQCADCLNIRSTQPQLALACLQDAFPKAVFSIMPDDSLRAEGDVSAEEIGSALFQAGIVVTELYARKGDIEELFVNLMGTDTSALASKVAASSKGAWGAADQEDACVTASRTSAGKKGGHNA